MMYLLIAVGVVFALLMLAGLWLSFSVLADTLLAPFHRAQDEEQRRPDRELKKLMRSAEREVRKANKPQ